MCCFRGGIGRRVRLKIVYPKDVRVRVPWGAPFMIYKNTYGVFLLTKKMNEYIISTMQSGVI